MRKALRAGIVANSKICRVRQTRKLMMREWSEAKKIVAPSKAKCRPFFEYSNSKFLYQINFLLLERFALAGNVLHISLTLATDCWATLIPCDLFLSSEVK